MASMAATAGTAAAKKNPFDKKTGRKDAQKGDNPFEKSHVRQKFDVLDRCARQ